MPRKLRELRSELRRAGFRIVRQPGSHQVWDHPQVPGIGAVIVGRDGADAKDYQEREVRNALHRLQQALNAEEES